MEDHACYVKNWLRVLKQDKRAIFTAASPASKAHGYIVSFAAREERVADNSLDLRLDLPGRASGNEKARSHRLFHFRCHSHSMVAGGLPEIS